MERFFSQENFGPDGRNAWDWLDDAVINSRGFVQPSEFLDHHHHHHHHRNSEGAGAGVEAGAGGASSHNARTRVTGSHWDPENVSASVCQRKSGGIFCVRVRCSRTGTALCFGLSGPGRRRRVRRGCGRCQRPPPPPNT